MENIMRMEIYLFEHLSGPWYDPINNSVIKSFSVAPNTAVRLKIHLLRNSL